MLRLAPQANSKYLPGSAYALLIQPHGDHHERVGIAHLLLRHREKRVDKSTECEPKKESKPRAGYMHGERASCKYFKTMLKKALIDNHIASQFYV